MLYKTAEMAKQIKPQTLLLTSLYLREPKRNYLYVDIDKSYEIIELKKQVKENYGSLIIPTNWDVVQETPHITLANIVDKFDAVNEILPSFTERPILEFNAIEVSYGGPWGTCIGTIKTFDLP